MQLVELHIINNKEIEDLCIKSKNLYNQALYYTRQAYFGKIQYFTEYDLSKILAEFNEKNYRALPPQTSQQIIKVLFKSWKSYWTTLRDYKKNPQKYSGKPKIPNYKKKAFVVIFTNQAARLQKNGYIKFPKSIKLKPLKTNAKNISQVRIVPQANTFKIEVIYEKEEIDLKLNKENILSLDLGINNFVTAIDNVGTQPFIINGKILKSFNQWYNKNLALYKSYVGDRGTSKRLKKLTHYRNCYIEDKLHKISKNIIDHCVQNNIGTIVIGKNKNWKQNINLGSKTNQKFAELPHTRLIDKITYKAKLLSISIELTEESYTSKCDNLALEPLYKHETYVGKRIKRGLFQSSVGKLINADVNGALGIGRKVFGDSFVKTISNSGNVFLPYKINIL